MQAKGRLGFLVLLLLLLATPGRAVVDRIVAVVNEEIITLSEIERRMNSLLLEKPAPIQDRLRRQAQEQEMRQKVLDQLIEEKLVDLEAKRLKIKVGAKEIEQAVEEVRRRNGMSPEQFEEALKAHGFTLETFKAQMEQQLVRSRALQMLVKVDPKMGDQELQDFYQNHQEQYRTVESYRPAHILFRTPPGASPEELREIRNKCESVLARIKKGEDFGEMAFVYSEDASAKDRGDLGFFKKGELLPQIEKEALRLQVGEVSGVVRSDLGFHIIKLLDRKGGTPLPFEQIKEKVKADYYQREAEKAVKKFINSLRARSIIEIRL